MQTSQCRRRSLLAATACLVIGAAVPARATNEQAVIAPIKQLVDGLLRVMKAGPGVPFKQRADMLAPVINQTFDLDLILRNSIGLAWDSLTSDQKAMLGRAFQRYTVASYVNSFNDFDGQRFEINPETRAVGDEQVVRTRIIPKSGESHNLDYVMRKIGSDWRAVDVLADGSISRVAVQRSDFRRLLVRGGAQALAQNLLTKSTDLSNGSG